MVKCLFDRVGVRMNMSDESGYIVSNAGNPKQQ